MDYEERITSAQLGRGEERNEFSIRPKSLDEYIGQKTATDNLKVFIEAAKMRGEPLDHVLFYGPPGLGKTTLAGIIANEMGVDIRITSGPAIERAGDSAMEDYALDIIIGKGPSARSIRLDIAKFTLIGATTRAGSLSAPLRDRFGVSCKFEMYTPDELADIIRRTAGLLDVSVDEQSVYEMARRSRGTPRVANRILKRVRDFSQVKGTGSIDVDITRSALEALGVDFMGLENLDREILRNIIDRFDGGPVGIDTIAASARERRTSRIVFATHSAPLFEPFFAPASLTALRPNRRAGMTLLSLSTRQSPSCRYSKISKKCLCSILTSAQLPSSFLSLCTTRSLEESRFSAGFCAIKLFGNS